MTIGSRIVGLVRRLTPVNPGAPPQAGPTVPPARWEDQWSGLDLSAWIEARRAAGRLYADLPAARVAALAARCPDDAARKVAAADRICRHEFDLLGSGPYRPVDPTRRAGADGYQPIDWAFDPIAALRFPTGFAHTSWTPDMRPGLADIKLPWELGRCQHWVTLGQAWRLTGDSKYAIEILREHADFLEANPVGTGVQYTCTMDVAIRALNWALAFELVRTAPAFDVDAARHAYRSLFDLAVFIEGNLENTYEVTSNHFLSNVVGLYGAGLVFRDLPAGRRWCESGRGWLEQEIRVQVLPDGADYESSIPYHRLVAELFLSGFRLAQLEGWPLSDEYVASLRRMIDFLAAVIRPDGLLPQVGDADDGRLHIFTGYGSWNPQDGRHLAAPAALLLDRPSWLALGGERGVWEAAWWGCDPDAMREDDSGRRDRSELFPDAGIAVARSAESYLLVTNGRVGTNGFGNHKHNDHLGFEFHAEGAPLLVDPGSYVYTSDPDARNLFRSTGYHNTVSVDGVEQDDLKPEFLFRLFETSTVEHVRFTDTPTFVEYNGRHTGYGRLPSPVVHDRALRLVKTPGALLIVDRLRGGGAHRLRWHFHLAPGCGVEAVAPGEFAVVRASGRFRFRAPADLTPQVGEAWYSPSYGVRVPCRAIDFTCEAVVSDARTYFFAIGPEAWLASGASVAALAVFQADIDARERASR